MEYIISLFIVLLCMQKGDVPLELAKHQVHHKNVDSDVPQMDNSQLGVVCNDRDNTLYCLCIIIVEIPKGSIKYVTV